MRVVCAAPDASSLSALKRAAVGAEWELAPGATSLADTLAQLEDHHAQVLVVQGVPGLVAEARRRHPGLRIIVVGSPGGDGDAAVVVSSPDGVRDAILGAP